MPQSLGIETKGGVFTPLIERGTPLPAQRSEIFTTADDNQASIKITLLQGDHKRAARNKKLGVFELSGIAPQPRQVPQIMVAFNVDFTGITVSAMDLRAGSAMPVIVSSATA
jgi:molecular chaperone DnaK